MKKLLLAFICCLAIAETPPAPDVKAKVYDAAGNPISSVGGSLDVNVTGGSSQGGRTSVALIRNVYSSTNVTTSAYIQLIASTSATINNLNIFDSSGQTLALAVGASGHEMNQIYIVPGGTGSIDLEIPSGSRVSVIAISGTANVGELDITFLE